MGMADFDFIVVGGGSAGCACAGRLAELTSARICVLEAGPSDRDLRVRVPLGLIRLVGSRDRDWRRRTLQQVAAGGREISVPRGRMLGGSGSLNSMVWFRGRRDDFDAWGVTGWRADDVWADFDAVEARIRPERLAHPHPLAERFGRALPQNDPMAPPTPERETSGVVVCNLARGARVSAADAFLRPAIATGRVAVRVGAEAAKVSVTNNRVDGVHLRDGQRLTASRGVILAAGAIESPMVLMRSGIGPGPMLRAAGIEVVRDAPEVGGNLHDHPGFGLHFAGAGSGYGLEWRQLPGWALAPFRYAATRTGRLASNTVEACAFFRAMPGDGPPDIQTHFIPFMMGWQGRSIVWGAGYFADACVMQPRSRGSLSLSGRDLFTPRIDLGLLTDPHDLQVLTAGVVRLRALLQQAPLGDRRAREGFPGAEVEGATLAETIRARCGTAYHPVGTAALGGPVDARGAVRGLDGLWVADASVMPRLTSANTNAPSMMIGWRIAGMIAGNAGARQAA